METIFPRFTLITQNVDGLHQRAGSRNVVELHGNISKTKCFDEDTFVSQWEETGDMPPKCPICGGLLRPAVVWFEEALPEDAIQKALAAARTCDVFLSVGTSTVVYPAAGLPATALEQGAFVVEINPQATPFTDSANLSLRGAAGMVLPELLKAFKERRN